MGLWDCGIVGLWDWKQFGFFKQDWYNGCPDVWNVWMSLFSHRTQQQVYEFWIFLVPILQRIDLTSMTYFRLIFCLGKHSDNI